MVLLAPDLREEVAAPDGLLVYESNSADDVDQLSLFSLESAQAVHRVELHGLLVKRGREGEGGVAGSVSTQVGPGGSEPLEGRPEDELLDEMPTALLVVRGAELRAPDGEAAVHDRPLADQAGSAYMYMSRVRVSLVTLSS